jgi:RNA recognition motif. (a.k.a. RRM, RBD, or RNP domain)
LKRLFVGNLPSDATEETVTTLFAQFGKVRSIQLVADIFSGKCRGLDGNLYCGKPLKVKFEDLAAVRGGRR